MGRAFLFLMLLAFSLILFPWIYICAGLYRPILGFLMILQSVGTQIFIHWGWGGDLSQVHPVRGSSVLKVFKKCLGKRTVAVIVFVMLYYMHITFKLVFHLRYERLQKTCSIALVGKYTKLRDCYASVFKALEHSALAINHKLNLMVSPSCSSIYFSHSL